MTAHRRATILLVATTQFVVLTLVAMTTYAGGTYFDASTRSYRFFENFFSDLGTTRSYSGRPNWVSCVLFVIALATMGSSLVVFSGGWRSFAFERRRGAFFGATGRGLGTLSGICFVGIALTPFDRALDAHNLLVMAAFSLLLGYVGCLTVLFVRNGLPRSLVLSNVAYFGVLVAYVWLLFFGPRFDAPGGLAMQCGGQKVIVYASMANLLLMANVIRRRAHA